MTSISRIITTGRNNLMPRLIVCRSCEGTGYEYAYEINPSAKPFKIDCPECFGEGCVYTNSPAPRAEDRPAPLTSAPGWATHTGTTPGSGAAAVLRHTHDTMQSLRPMSNPVGIGHLEDLVMDFLKVSAGLAVFTLIASFFWVLA